jgi:hypothetical protein
VYLKELKLPDHVFLRRNGTVSIVERGSATERSLKLPAPTRVVEKKSAARYLGALASAVFVVYFASLFLDSLFATALEIALLVALIGVPFLIDRLFGGRIAVFAYLGTFIAFALLRGGLATGSLRLGLIFFGGSPVDYQGYAIVPASDLITTLVIGLLPFATAKMLGQVAVRYGIIIGSGGDEYTLWVRHLGLVRETLAFLGDQRTRDLPEGEDR